jgi:hypothetical protein
VAKVNSRLTTPLKVLVRDVNQNPVPDVSVTFVAPGAGASGRFVDSEPTSNVVFTGNDGIATANGFVTNCTLGSYSILATVSGVPNNATFAITNLLGDAINIRANSGGNQSTKIGTTFANPVQVIVTDSCGNPIDGTSITFIAPTSGAGGNFQGATTVNTQGGGLANAPLLNANSTSGNFNVTAQLNRNNARINVPLTNLPADAANITASAGAGQITNANTLFATSLRATVTDSFGNPVQGALVTFTAPASGAGALFTSGSTTISATVSTDASGFAYAPPLQANCVPGNFNVVASVPGIANTANFNLTSTPGIPNGVTVFSGSPQTATVANNFQEPLKAKVIDSCSNPVIDSSVVFNVLPSPAQGLFSGIFTSTVANTDLQGIATTSPIVANTVAGDFTVQGVSFAANETTSFQLKNKAGSPASVAVVSGSSQSAKIGTTYQFPFIVKVKDAFGNPVQGVSVLFDAPDSGAAGQFNNQNFVTVETDATGSAIAPPFSANALVGQFDLVASVQGGGNANFTLTNLAGDAANITVVSGTGQSAGIGAAFAAPLVARVTDAGGNPINGVNVTFTAPNSGAGGLFAGGSISVTVSSNSNGLVTSPVLTATGTAGNFEVVARAVGVVPVATFNLTNTPGAPVNIVPIDGTPQSIAMNRPFSTTLKAKVFDAGNNPVPGVSVIFSTPSSGATARFAGNVNQQTVTTGLDGVAIAPTLTANNILGSYVVTASIIGVTPVADFNLTNTVGPPATIAAVSGGGQTAQIGNNFAQPLRAVVRDLDGNPINGVTVTFTAPNAGASVVFPGGGISTTATTDATGIATSPAATANNKTGSFNVVATVSGVSAGATFNLTITPGAPVNIVAVAGTPQSVRPNEVFTTPMRVLVTDIGNNPVPGVNVTFTAPVPAPSGRFAGNQTVANATTLADGTATAPTFTALATSGNFSLTATAPGAGSATFALRVLVGPPAQVIVLAGNGQTTVVDNNFANALRVRVTDAQSNPVESVTVNFAATPVAGAAATFAGPFVTNALGELNITARANQTAGGPYTVTASVPGATPGIFQLTNIAGAPATITVTGGSPQTANIGANFSQFLTVTVRDSFNNPAPGLTIEYLAPAAGASVVFPAGNTNTTNALGQASVQVRANYFVGGPYIVNARVVSAPAVTTSPGNPGFSLTNALPATGASLTLAGGSPQTTQAYALFGQNLQASVTFAGNPVGGVTVTFVAPPVNGGPSVTFPSGSSATTNAGGIASLQVRANGNVGPSYLVTATAASVAGSATFQLTNTLPGGLALSIISGNNQSINAGSNFGQPLVVRLTSGGNPVGGVTITYNGPASGASVTFPAGNTAVTDFLTGDASVTPQANNTLGNNYTITAQATGGPNVNITASNTLPPSAVVELVSGNNQTTDVLNPFNQFVVRVRRGIAPAEPVLSNVNVTFTPPPGPNIPTLRNTTPVNNLTDAIGQASYNNPEANNWVGGSFTVIASIANGATTNIGGLNNRLPPSATLEIRSGDLQTAVVNNAYANPLVVRVRIGGNTIGGVTVNFATVTPGQFSFSGGATDVTDNNGDAVKQVIANCTTNYGTFEVRASTVASGLVPPLIMSPDFRLIISPGYTIAFVDPNPQTTGGPSDFPPFVNGHGFLFNDTPPGVTNFAVEVRNGCGTLADGVTVRYNIFDGFNADGFWHTVGAGGFSLVDTQYGVTGNSGTGRARPFFTPLGFNFELRVAGFTGNAMTIRATVDGTGTFTDKIIIRS